MSLVIGCDESGRDRDDKGRFLSTHGGTDTPEYRSWCHIIDRCCNPRCQDYPNWGGRGITIYEGWRHDFQAFRDYLGPRPGSGYSVERIKNERGYEPGNVRWATRKEQARNMRVNTVLTFEGRSQPIAAWAEERGINPCTLMSRLIRGWLVEKALSTGVKPKRVRKGFVEFAGRRQSLPKWAAETGIPFKTLAARLSKGWPVERALTTPVGAKT